jgi:isopentenyl-diphosphate Delta-isomerase
VSDTQPIMIPAWVDGVLTPVGKLAAHEQGLRHKAVSVFILHQGRVLLQQRALHKYHTPGLWANTCCTHPHWDEPAYECAIRRLDDELGITAVPLKFRDQIEYRADVGNGLIEHEVVDVFVGEAPDAMQVTINPDEVLMTRWVTLADLANEIGCQPSVFTPWLKIYMAKHSAAIFGR